MSTTCFRWSPVTAEGLGLTPHGADVVSSSPDLRLLSDTSSPLREELLDTVTNMYFKHSVIGWMDSPSGTGPVVLLNLGKPTCLGLAAAALSCLFLCLDQSCCSLF